MELLTGEVQLAAGADALASRGAALVLATLGPAGRVLPCCGGPRAAACLRSGHGGHYGRGRRFSGSAAVVPCGQDAGRAADIAAGTVGAHCRVCKRSGQPDHRGKGAIPAMPAREQILRLCGE